MIFLCCDDQELISEKPAAESKNKPECKKNQNKSLLNLKKKLHPKKIADFHEKLAALNQKSLRNKKLELRIVIKFSLQARREIVKVCCVISEEGEKLEFKNLLTLGFGKVSKINGRWISLFSRVLAN